MKPDTKPDRKSREKGDSSQPQKKDTAFLGKVAIVIIVSIIVIAAIFFMINSPGTSSGSTTSVPPQECADRIISYANTHLVAPNSTLSFVSINENRGIYEIKTRYQSKETSLYATRDCALLFPNVVNMSAATATQTPTQTPVKSSRPSVDLYVMSFCPYGVQAETVMKPVVDLLGSKADIQVRYITTINGTTVSSVKSLHGSSEAQEDLRQLCILKSYPEKYWNYLNLFNTRCYPVWQNASSLDSCRKNVTATLGIDLSKTDACAAGTEGLALLKQDETKVNQNGATASPTLIINGVKFSGSRTPEAFKTAICNSFDKVPAECTTTLASASAAAASGGCG
jgi:glutaredoxin